MSTEKISWVEGNKEFEKYFPAARPLLKILIFSFRMSGVLFGLGFAGVPSYLIWTYVLPIYADPLRSAGERWGATAFAGFGLFFIVAGVLIFRFSLTRNSFPRSEAPRSLPSLPAQREMLERARYTRNQAKFGLKKMPDGGATLSSAYLYRVTAIAVGLFAVLWNGITFLGFFDVQGFGSLFSILHFVFMLPFLTVGFGLTYVFFKLLVSLKQPTLEFHLPKSTFTRGETFRVEVRLKDPKRLARNLQLTLRKRFLRPDDEGSGLSSDGWIVDERIVLERDSYELGFEWSDSVPITLPMPGVGMNEEWSEWSLEAKVETGSALPLYILVPLPYEWDES